MGTIGATAESSSLNLAQAAAVYCHEVWVARGGDAIALKPPRHSAAPATHEQLEALFGSWEASLHDIEVLKQGQPGLANRGRGGAPT